MSQFKTVIERSHSNSAFSTYLALHPALPRHERIRQYVVFHRQSDLSTLLQRKALELGLHLYRVSEDIEAFSLKARIGREKEREISGSFVVLPGSKPDFHRIITISRSEFWEILTRIVRQLYPEAMPVFFKQAETRQALLTLSSALGRDYRITLRDVTMKRKITDGTARDTSRIETDRLWSKLSISEAYDHASEGSYWFTSIGFDVEKRRDQTNRYSQVATGRIYKYGAINYSFMHQEINESAVQILEKHAAERLSFLSGRGLREQNYQPRAPIQISYDRDLFDHKEEVRKFGEVIAEYPHSTRAIFHPNPYYHASLADFLDGSSVELWILSPRRILIAPQAKCTEQALERLISHIFFEYDEGEISEYRRTEQ